jgi:hypothetical protein
LVCRGNRHVAKASEGTRHTAQFVIFILGGIALTLCRLLPTVMADRKALVGRVAEAECAKRKADKQQLQRDGVSRRYCEP